MKKLTEQEIKDANESARDFYRVLDGFAAACDALLKAGLIAARVGAGELAKEDENVDGI